MNLRIVAAGDEGRLGPGAGPCGQEDGCGGQGFPTDGGLHKGDLRAGSGRRGNNKAGQQGPRRMVRA